MLFAEEVRRGEEVTRYRWNQKKKAMVFEIATVEGVVATFSFRTARLNQSHRDFQARSTHFSIIAILSSQRTYVSQKHLRRPADHFLCHFQRQHADLKEQLTSLPWKDIVRGCPTFIGPFLLTESKKEEPRDIYNVGNAGVSSLVLCSRASVERDARSFSFSCLHLLLPYRSQWTRIVSYIIFLIHDERATFRPLCYLFCKIDQERSPSK